MQANRPPGGDPLRDEVTVGYRRLAKPSSYQGK